MEDKIEISQKLATDICELIDCCECSDVDRVMALALAVGCLIEYLRDEGTNYMTPDNFIKVVKCLIDEE